MAKLTNKQATAISLEQPIQFKLAEANQLLQLVQSITKQAVKRLEPVQQQLHVLVPADPRVQALNEEYTSIVANWQGKISRLGLHVHGLWQVGFDCREGWFAWRYPERKIRYFVEYGNEFEDRVLYKKSQEQCALQWAIDNENYP